LRARSAAWTPRWRTAAGESSRTLRRAPAQRRTSPLSSSIQLHQRLPRRPLCRVPRRALPASARRTRRRVLHPGSLERRPPAAAYLRSWPISASRSSTAKPASCSRAQFLEDAVATHVSLPASWTRDVTYRARNAAAYSRRAPRSRCLRSVLVWVTPVLRRRAWFW
jgi:hypothetical protein